MSEPTSKEIREKLGNAISLAFRHFCEKYRNGLWALIKKATIYLLHMFVLAWFFVGILYPIAANNPDTILLADKGIKAAINITSSFWGALVDIGTIMAGAGTVGLLLFGWVKADEWKQQLILREKLNSFNNWHEEALNFNSHLKELLKKIGHYNANKDNFYQCQAALEKYKKSANTIDPKEISRLNTEISISNDLYNAALNSYNSSMHRMIEIRNRVERVKRSLVSAIGDDNLSKLVDSSNNYFEDIEKNSNSSLLYTLNNHESELSHKINAIEDEISLIKSSVLHEPTLLL